MPKVTYEFDENKDLEDINLIINRHKLSLLVNELYNFRRDLYKGYVPEGVYISIKDNKVVTAEDREKAEGLIEGTKGYIDDDYVIDEIDRILDNVKGIIDLF